MRAADNLGDILSPPQRICVSLREVHLVTAQSSRGKWPAGAVWRMPCLCVRCRVAKYADSSSAAELVARLSLPVPNEVALLAGSPLPSALVMSAVLHKQLSSGQRSFVQPYLSILRLRP